MIKKICIIVDHPFRELDYITLLAFKLLKNVNFEVFLVEQYKKEFINFINPHLVIFPHARLNMLPLIKICKERNILISIIETEGGFIGKLWTGRKKYFKRTMKIVDLYFCWEKKNYLEIKKFKKNNLIFSGTPKFDFLRPELSNFYKSKKKNITFVSNFALTNPKFNTIEQKIDEIKYSEFFNRGKRKIADYMNLEREILNKFIDLVRKTAMKFKKRKIILKIHPFENEKTYSKKLKLKNLILVQNENIVKTISKSDQLIHYNCQTSFEFYLNKKAPISYSFLLNQKEKENKLISLEKISIKPKNLLNFYKFIFKKNKIKMNKNIINQYGFNSNVLSSDIIVKNILKKLSQKKNIVKSTNYYSKRYGYYLLFKGFFLNSMPKKIISVLKHFLKKKQFTDKQLNIKEIKHIIKKLNYIYPNNQKIHITYPKIFLFLDSNGLIKLSK